MLAAGIAQSAVGQIQLKCPPCRPLVGCEQCWETEEEAQGAGCDNAGRFVYGQQPADTDISGFKLSLFPNPNHGGTFTVISDKALYGQLSIVDPMGRVISIQTLDGENTIPMNESLPQGVYVLIFKSNTGKLIKMKLLSK